LLSLCTPMFPPLPHLPSFPTRRSSDLNHGPGEEARLSRVKAASGDSDPLIYNGTLGALMALLRNALCVVGGDTGPLHLAVALGTPVVALFGPTDPARNGPYRPGARSAKDLVLRSEEHTS